MSQGRRRLIRASASALVALPLALVAAGCGGGGPTSASGSSPGSVRVDIVTSTTGPDGNAPTTLDSAGGGRAPGTASAGGSSPGAPAGSGAGGVGGGKAPATTAKVPALTHGANGGYTVVAYAIGPTVAARTAPDAAAPVVASLANPIESGTTLVFAAVADQPANAEWIQVHLPVKPNNTVGWIRRDQVKLYSDPYRMEINRASFSLRVYKADQLWVDTKVGLGNGDTPTPVGVFYLTELLAPPNPNGAYGPYAFGLSGFSETLASFGGSNKAVIGIHGTNDPSSIGSTVSHGCIRVDNKTITQLAKALPLGTPVVIT